MHDVSNDSDAYDRNRLRHHVIPAVRSYAGAAWPGVMADTARLFQALDAFLAHHVDRLAGECLEEQHDAVVLAVQPLKRYFEFEQLSLLRHALTRLRGSEGMFDEVFSLKHLIDAEPGKRAVLRGGVIAFRESSRIIVRMPATVTEPQCVAPDGRYRHGTAVFTIERCDRAMVRMHRDAAEEYIDLTRTGEEFLLRAWTSEDVFTPLGFGSEKRVGAFLADSGIPWHRRVRIPVLTGREGIVWVCGVRLDEHARIRDESTDIARIRYSISSDAS
jgi:tRNA(Ile)-lysidine synthase